MKKLETEVGAYKKEDICARVIYLPDNEDETSWKLISEAEYQKYIKDENKRNKNKE